MKTNTFTNYCIALLLIAGLGFAACKKDKNENTDTQSGNTEYAEDIASLDQSFDEMDNFVSEIDMNGDAGLKGGIPLSGCASITRDTGRMPRKIIIDFGTTNCLCKDGRYRRGKILVSFMKRYRDSGYVHNISFDSYYVNDNHVLGTKEVSNMGRNDNGKIHYKISVNGQIVLNATGDTLSHTADRVRTWVEGDTTRLWIRDDVYNITGTGSYTKRNGKTYSSKITNALVAAVNCRWIKQGTIEITPQGGSTAILDYGNGKCDDTASVTANWKTRTIILR